MSDLIDLDFNVTTPVAHEMLDAMLPWCQIRSRYRSTRRCR